MIDNTTDLAVGNTFEIGGDLTATVVADREVLHSRRCEEIGIAISRVVTLALNDGRQYVVEFWHHYSAPNIPLHHIGGYFVAPTAGVVS